MKKFFYLLVPIITVIVFILYNNLPKVTQQSLQSQPSTIPTATSPAIINYQATFEIVTNGTKRVFTDKKYHNHSKDVFLAASDPSVIHIKKSGITWADFFKTLPMQLSKDCLVTGTQQTFCNNKTMSLQFYINGERDDTVLNKVIQKNDQLLVSYGRIDNPTIMNQSKQVTN